MAQIISIHSIQSPTSTNRHPQPPLQHSVSRHEHSQQAGFHLGPITQRCTTHHHPTTRRITITTKPPPLPHTLANASSQNPTEPNPSSQQNKSVQRNTEIGGLPDRVPNMQGNMPCHAMPCRCHLSVPIHEKTRLLSITSSPPPSSKTVSTFNKPHTPPASLPPASYLRLGLVHEAFLFLNIRNRSLMPATDHRVQREHQNGRRKNDNERMQPLKTNQPLFLL